MTSIEQLQEEIQDYVGSDLRAIIEYNGLERKDSLRDDLQQQYSDTELQQIISESVVLQLGVRDRPSSLKTGDLTAIIRTYESAWIISCPHPKKRKAGILVSIERDRGAATLADVEQCMELLEETLALDSN